MTDPIVEVGEPSSPTRELYESAKRLLTDFGTEKRLIDDFERLADHGVLWANEQSFGPRDDLWGGIIDSGWFETLVPAELDGLGLGLEALSSLFFAAGESLCGVALHTHALTLPLLLRRVGSGAARALVADGIRGARIFGTVESAGYPYAESITYENSVLGGSASPVPDAELADYLVVIVPGAQSAVVLIQASAAHLQSLGSADLQTRWCAVSFDAVRPAHVLLEGPAAAGFIDELHGAQRLMAASELCGAAVKLHVMTTDWAKSRYAFGRPIAAFQALRHMIAEMTTDVVSLHNLCHFSCVDADERPDRALELGSIAKSYAGGVARSTAETALQIHGAAGFLADFSPLHLYYRRILTLQGAYGDSRRLQSELGHRELERAS